LSLAFGAALVLPAATPLLAQGGDQTLYGDLVVDESRAEGLTPLSFDIILYTEARVQVARQTISSTGRYRFNNLKTGIYQLVIEVEGREVARLRVDLLSPLIHDLRQDVALEWRSPAISSKPGVISADQYPRPPRNEALFKQARAAGDKKKYAKAAELLQRVVQSDANDFQAWAELASVHFLQKNFDAAEIEYLRAIDAHPGFFPALLNLGRLEVAQKKYEVAVEALSKAVKLRPESADANYLLGEAYLQLKRGALAVAYLNEALRLDPLGMAEVHLRLATLYHAAGLRDKASAEYERFLKKRPDYSDRQKLEKYIARNRKQ
jgi:tetratricopeptide (TPR) repeat protein